jgi:hypothetical protein
VIVVPWVDGAEGAAEVDTGDGIDSGMAFAGPNDGPPALGSGEGWFGAAFKAPWGCWSWGGRVVCRDTACMQSVMRQSPKHVAFLVPSVVPQIKWYRTFVRCREHGEIHSLFPRRGARMSLREPCK